MEQKVTKFIANFYLCSIRKNPPQNGAKIPQNGAKIHQIYCKHRIFFTWVYMIFKYSKRFRIFFSGCDCNSRTTTINRGFSLIISRTYKRTKSKSGYQPHLPRNPRKSPTNSPNPKKSPNPRKSPTTNSPSYSGTTFSPSATGWFKFY